MADHRQIIDGTWAAPGHCSDCWDPELEDYVAWIRAILGGHAFMEPPTEITALAAAAPNAATPADRILVTIADTSNVKCDHCGHDERLHGDSGCHLRSPVDGRCLCLVSHADVTRAHWTGVVRREIVTELTRMAGYDAEQFIEGRINNLTTYRAVRVDTIANRIREICNDL